MSKFVSQLDPPLSNFRGRVLNSNRSSPPPPPPPLPPWACGRGRRSFTYVTLVAVVWPCPGFLSFSFSDMVRSMEQDAEFLLRVVSPLDMPFILIYKRWRIRDSWTILGGEEVICGKSYIWYGWRGGGWSWFRCRLALGFLLSFHIIWH